MVYRIILLKLNYAHSLKQWNFMVLWSQFVIKRTDKGLIRHSWFFIFRMYSLVDNDLYAPTTSPTVGAIPCGCPFCNHRGVAHHLFGCPQGAPLRFNHFPVFNFSEQAQPVFRTNGDEIKTSSRIIIIFKRIERRWWISGLNFIFLVQHPFYMVCYQTYHIWPKIETGPIAYKSL